MVGKLLSKAHDCGGQQLQKKDLKEKEKTQTKTKKTTTTTQEEAGKKKGQEIGKKNLKKLTRRSRSCR
jgi:hypothetical protein